MDLTCNCCFVVLFLSADPRLGPPPDLPSLLLHNRIVYLGMALVPAVTELVRHLPPISTASGQAVSDASH